MAVSRSMLLNCRMFGRVKVRYIVLDTTSIQEVVVIVIEPAESLFILLVMLQVKHLFADYGLQFGFMLRGRDDFFHAGRLAHVAIHAAGSGLALFVLGTQAGLLQVLVVAEGVAHYLIDWSKAAWVAKRALTPQDRGFWWATGADQCLHQLSYLALCWGWLTL